jgi:putative endonuclease
VSTYRAALGTRGEDIAAAFLQARGYTIVARNYRCRFGEIDLVCTHDAVVVFCEVKLRRSDRYGAPEEGVTARKLARLTLAACTYLAEHGLEEADWRIDVVALELDRRGGVVRTALYQAVGSD